MQSIASIDDANKLFQQFLARAYNVVYNATVNVELPNWQVREALVLAYQATILEITQGIQTLLDAKNGRSAFILLRSALEAYIDLKGTLEVKGYPDRRELDFIKDRLRVLNEAKAGHNFALGGLMTTAEADISDQERRAHELKSRGATTTKIKDRFALAGEADMYSSVYNRLCAASHNDPGEIAWRHLHQDEAGVPSLVMFREANPIELLLLLDTLSGIVVQSAICVQSLPDIKNDGASIDQLGGELTKIRKQVAALLKSLPSNDADDPAKDL
ncbi:DUF5677 domain-containing protein [Aestuariivirga sp.]|uniref:DUF5677 domain-containing protein n=1 Tax=Aestuariivirga sp. TaxID=2650926 RepID=UPI0030196902